LQEAAENKRLQTIKQINIDCKVRLK